MHKDPRIEQQIADILTGSGLPMDRRRDVANEMRGHLEQSIASKCVSGLTENEAIKSALAEFGSPKVLRKQLRAQQRVLDRREAFAQLRRQIWLPIIYAGVFMFCSGYFSLRVSGMRTQPPRHIELFTTRETLHLTIVFLGLFFLVAVFMYVGALFECQAKRLRPRHEYHFLKSFLRWITILCFGFVAILVLIMFLAGFWMPLVSSWASPLVFNNRFADHFVWLFSQSFVTAWIESAVRNFVLCSVGVLGFGLALALYERTRCVDEPAVPEVD